MTSNITKKNRELLDSLQEGISYDGEKNSGMSSLFKYSGDPNSTFERLKMNMLQTEFDDDAPSVEEILSLAKIMDGKLPSELDEMLTSTIVEHKKRASTTDTILSSTMYSSDDRVDTIFPYASSLESLRKRNYNKFRKKISKILSGFDSDSISRFDSMGDSEIEDWVLDYVRYEESQIILADNSGDESLDDLRYIGRITDTENGEYDWSKIEIVPNPDYNSAKKRKKNKKKNRSLGKGGAYSKLRPIEKKSQEPSLYFHKIGDDDDDCDYVEIPKFLKKKFKEYRKKKERKKGRELRIHELRELKKEFLLREREKDDKLIRRMGVKKKKGSGYVDPWFSSSISSYEDKKKALKKLVKKSEKEKKKLLKDVENLYGGSDAVSEKMMKFVSERADNLTKNTKKWLKRLK